MPKCCVCNLDHPNTAAFQQFVQERQADGTTTRIALCNTCFMHGVIFAARAAREAMQAAVQPMPGGVS